jgi:hypothetical protein
LNPPEPPVWIGPDGGSSWKITGLANYEVLITAIDPQKPQLLYAGTKGNGLYKSYNAGEAWGNGPLERVGIAI